MIFETSQLSMRLGEFSTKESARRYYQERFSGAGGELIKQQEEKILKSLKRFLKDDESVILDIGAGTGRATEILSCFLKIRKAVLVDPSREMLLYAQQQVGNSFPIECICQKIEECSIPEGQFDIAIALHLMKHLHDPEVMFNIVRRSLRRHGVLIFEFVNRRSLAQFTLKECLSYTMKEITDILEKSGFRIVKYSFVNMFGETILLQSPHFLLRFFFRLDNFLLTIFPTFATKVFILAQKQ